MSCGSETMRSGLMCHLDKSSNCFGGGMSAGLPIGAPPSAQRAIVSISSSVSDGSFWNFLMPTVRSIYQGGISRLETLVRIDLAHGRTSWYFKSDIGAMESGRWHTWHERWRIGATSLVNVGT